MLQYFFFFTHSSMLSTHEDNHSINHTMSRKKEQPVIEDLLITDVGAEGKAIAHIDGMVVFVPFVVPGDVVDVKILKKKKKYAEGRAVNVKHYSDKRATPQCPHFGTCGGCRWQNLQYDQQLAAKQQQVRDNLERLGHIDCQGMLPICGSEDIFYYRNKLEFTFSTRAWHELPPAKDAAVDPEGEIKPDGALGFHIPTLFDKVLNIEHCALQQDLSNQIRLSVRDYAEAHALPYYDIRNHTGCLRNLIIRNSSTGEWMVVLVIAEYHPGWEGLMEHLRDQFPQITSLQYIFNNKMNDAYAEEKEEAKSEESAPKGRDYKAEVEDLLKIRPMYSEPGKRLPEEVTKECIETGRPLTVVYLEWEAKQEKAKYDALLKENKKLKQNAEAASRAPVRGVSKGGPTKDKANDDPFLKGFDSEF